MFTPAPRRRLAIGLIDGIDDGVDRTLAEVGDEMGVTPPGSDR